MKLNKYIRHVMELARQNGIELRSVNHYLHSNAAPLNNVVYAKPPTNYVEYAIALHEMGHCMNKLTMDMAAYKAFMIQRQPKNNEEAFNAAAEYMRDHIPIDQLIMDETRAWNWAQANALEWTPPMEYTRQYGITSHLNRGHAREEVMKMCQLHDSLPDFESA